MEQRPVAAGEDRHEQSRHFSPIRRCASAAKPAKSPAKNGTAFEEDGLDWSGFSYDNTGAVGHSTWRHVKFVETCPGTRLWRQRSRTQASWAFSSDVCKHCENAGCLEACPTGSIVRTEFGGVYVQPDICNGCGYCVVSCPFGVVERNPDDGRAFKCTFCYDRQKVGLSRLVRRRALPSQSIWRNFAAATESKRPDGRNCTTAV